jgi:hypothetical protein
MPALGNSLGDLRVNIGANTQGLTRGARESQTALQKVSARMTSVIKASALLAAAAAAAGAALTIGLVRSGLKSIDVLAKTSRNIGGTIDGLRGLQIAAGDAGIDQDALNSSMERLNARLGEAQRGTGASAESFRRLGLNAEELVKMDVDQRMAAIADRMQELGLSSSQTADELRQLGIRNTEMVGLMQQGGDAIRAARQEVDDFGLSVSAVDAAQIEAANDAMGRIGRVIEGIKNQLAIAFAPLLKEVADRFNAVAKEAGGFGSHARAAAEGAIIGAGFVGDAIQGVTAAYAAVKLAALDASVLTLQGLDAVVIAWNQVRLAMPGAEEFDPYETGLRDLVFETMAAADLARESFNSIMDSPSFSARAREFIEAVRKREREAAQETVKSREAMNTANSKWDSLSADLAAKEETRRIAELGRRRETLQGGVMALRDSLASEGELAETQHERTLMLLRDALIAQAITREEFIVLEEETERQHMKRMEEIRKAGLTNIERFTAMSMGAQTATVFGDLEAMTAGVAQNNRALFNINKVAGIANAIVSTHEGAAKALSFYPPPLSFAMAAVQVAAGLARVAAIRATQFGSGAAPSVAGTTPAPPVSPVGGNTQNVQVTLVGGSQIGLEQLQQLGELLSDNGGRIGSFSVQRG